jgi:hypothetical protein
MNPVDWNFQVYLKPTGMISTSGAASGRSASGNAMPTSDWFLWQSLMSNAAWASGTQIRSAWQDTGKFALAERNGAANVVAHTANFGTASEYYLYFKMDNVVYQVSNATVNQATVDAAIDGIATTTWTGFGTQLVELRGTQRDNAIAVFGGTLNSGTSITANANALETTKTYAYHPWNSYNVSGSLASASFIKNRLSTIDVKHAANATAAGVNFTFPVTAMSFDYNNNITYLSPEELSTMNTPIGQFTGARAISGSLSAYLRGGTDNTAQMFKQIVEDTRTSSAATSNANLKIGGATAPFFAINMPAVQFDVPSFAVEDVIGVSVNFLAQEINKGTGDELTLIVQK